MALAATSTLPAAKPLESTRVWSPVPLIAMVGIMVTLVGGWRWYQQVEGFKSGLDASTPEFTQKWMPVWYANVLLAGIAQVSIPLYFWFTRDRHLERLAPADELHRYFVMFTMLIAMTLTQTVSIIFGTADAAWHQVVVRDTSLTPSHIVLFFGIVPIFTCFGLSAFFYSFTRIPQFADKLSVGMLIGVTGPFLVLPSVAYNEWGHAYWLMEELFIAPLHWGFVILGIAFLAVLGVIVQSLPRVIELTRTLGGAKPAVARA